jgi:flavin-dependent dehydrogenase
MISQTHYDVIVIGGGPAGATAAALLAEKGRRVLLLEKEKFPRYHVGESMMPFCWFTLNRLGLTHRMEEVGYTKKYSVQFVRSDGQQSHPFYFFQHYDHPSSTTWQIERSDFDLMLLNRARELGAEVHEETAVRRILKNDSGAVIGVEAAGADGVSFTTYAPVTIDATGREGFAQIREGWRVRDQKLNKVSIWTYFRGAKRDPGLDEGTTTVAYIPERGWFWYIPLRNDIISVGVVAEKDYLFSSTRDPAEIMKREIQKNTVAARAPGDR